MAGAGAGLHGFAYGEQVEGVPPPTLGHRLPAPESAPVLPVRLWREGVFLFAATSPADPDDRLGLLNSEGGCSWQWLPLCGADFPLQTYAQRGPLVAWTPHLAGAAAQRERKP